MSMKFNFTVQQYYDKGQVKPSDIETLREHLKSQQMPHESDEMILVFFMASECDLEKAKRYSSVHYRGRRAVPEVFTNRNLKSIEMVKQWDVIEIGVMPKTADDGSTVIVVNVIDPVASHFQMDLIVKLILMGVDSVLYTEPVPGFTIMVDMKNVGFLHITRLHVGILKRILKYVGEGLLSHLKGVHYINGGFVLDKIYRLFKHLCRPELLKLFQFHSSGMKMEEFYEKCIPKKCLPSDYGGDDDSLKNLHRALWKKLEEIAPFFEQELNHRLPFETQSK